MSARNEIWLDEPTGNRICLLENLQDFAYTKVKNRVGAWTITLPGDFDSTLLRVDGMVEFWRAPEGGALRLEQVGFIRRIAFVSRGEMESIIISGPDPNDLLRRRIVAYYAGTAQAGMTDNADDIMKEVVDDNLESDSATDYDGAAVTGRNLASLNFTVTGDLSAGPSITKAFAWRNVLEVLQEIAESAEQAGTSVFFEVRPRVVSNTAIGFDFVTYTGQPGIDHSYGTGDAPVIFSREWGNLGEAVYERDYTEEVNFVYAGGQGEQSERNIQERSDTGRIAASIWNRCEGFADARDLTADAGVQARGDAYLAKWKPRRKFTGQLLDTKQARYGLDWAWGDKVTASFRGQQFDGVVTALEVYYDAQRGEQLVAHIEVDE